MDVSHFVVTGKGAPIKVLHFRNSNLKTRETAIYWDHKKLLIVGKN